MGPNNPKTNSKHQRKYVFVIVNVQKRISRKMMKNKQNPTKTSTRVERVKKSKLESEMSKSSSNCQKRPSEFQNLQD